MYVHTSNQQTSTQTMKTPLRVEVLGREYTLRVEEASAERTRAIAKQVDRRMRAFQRQHPEQAKLTTAIITALALAEDLRVEREERQTHADALDDDLRALTTRLTAALDEHDEPPGKNAAPASESG